MVIVLIIAALFIILRVVAAIRTEKSNINDDNPYLHPEKADVLPEDMRTYISSMPVNEGVQGNAYTKAIKRCGDLILSFCGLVILSPVFLILSLAVVIDDPGPVLFTQKRVGKNKAFFRLHKFRSMKMSTPHDIPTHMLANPDQYITKVGKFLRRTSLDELPQIWDIFRGKMSIIGPRPALWNQADLVAEREKYCANDAVPGLTGLAQITGRDELEIDTKAMRDGQYVTLLYKSGWSGFVSDVKIFFGTIFSVLKHEGVVEGGTGQIVKMMEEADKTTVN